MRKKMSLIGTLKLVTKAVHKLPYFMPFNNFLNFVKEIYWTQPILYSEHFNPLSANPTEWSNTFKQ